MRISEVVAGTSERSQTLRASVRPDSRGASFTAWFEVEGVPNRLHEAGDPFVVGFLVACMFEGENIHVDAPVSSALLANLHRAQNVLASWYDDFRPVDVTASEVVAVRPAASTENGLGCCFSGGVDSWYSLLKHQTDITDLLLIQGFDIATDNTLLWEQAASTARRVGREMGKRAITVSTNLRNLADKRRNGWGRKFDGDFWGQALHGSAIASVGLVLRDEFSTLIIPATHTEDRLRPWGSSPLLDPLWSDGRLAFVHDGCEASRVDKIRRIASNDIALETLRVCFCNTDRLNCCECEKCHRTMMALRACGALDRATAFPIALDLGAARRLTIARHLLPRYEEIMEAAELAGDLELARTCRIILGRIFSADRTLRLGWRRVRDSVRRLDSRRA